MKILTDFKRNDKSEYYKFFDDKEVFIVSKADLYNRMATRNIKVKNAYIRGRSIVVTGNVWRAKFKNKCLIPISMIDIMAKPFKIDSIVDVNVTPDMLDDTALKFIEKIGNAKIHITAV